LHYVAEEGKVQTDETWMAEPEKATQIEGISETSSELRQRKK
jgi:hypothetical protein